MGIEIEIKTLCFFTRYVDDVMVALVWDRTEIRSMVEMEQIMMDKMRTVADQVFEMLSFTHDHPGAHPSGWMPVLDTQIRSNNNRLEFKYYEKECANIFVIGMDSAMALATKRVVLVQEGLRRLLNTMIGLPPEIWQEIIEEFACKMLRSGYPSNFRNQVIHSALAAYCCRIRQDQEGLRPLYRPKEWQRESRDTEKLGKLSNWFKGDNDEQSVIFVTATPSSLLANNISKRLKAAKIPVKVAEKSGNKICQLLVKTNPHQVQECVRQDCLVCTSRTGESKGNSNCQKEGVCYSLKCQSCPEGDATYVGQTSSTAFVRGNEHQREYRLHEEGKEGGKKSVMGRHVAKEHEGNYSTAWTMTVLSHHP